MYKGYKIRLYPTKEQENLFWKHIHAGRFIYNYMLGYCIEQYKLTNKSVKFFDMARKVTSMRNEQPWLCEIDYHSLQLSCKDVATAFDFFFKGVCRFPRFKSRKSGKFQFPIRNDALYFKTKNLVMIPKCGKVKCKTDLDVNLGRYKLGAENPRITYKNGKWILSFAMECENQAPQKLNGSMGIDLGIKELATVSYNGEIAVFHNINKSKKMKKLESQINYCQKVFARKKYNSKHRQKQQRKLRKLYAKQSNIRHDYLHQITRWLVNQKPQRVVMEDLSVHRLAKNHFLAKLIYEQNFYEFKRQMRYKCEWAGIEFILADKFYPSSKTCSCCGNIKKDLKLSDRTYKCEKCGLIIDRDLNAAKNLEKYIA